MSRLLVLPLVAVLFLSLATAVAFPAPAVSSTLRIGLEAQPTTMDAALSTDLYSQQTYSHILEGLVMLDTQGVARPALAESWSTSADGRVWTFRLRQNVKWHDGTEFTAEDVKYTLDRILSPETRSPNRGSLAQITQVDPVEK